MDLGAEIIPGYKTSRDTTVSCRDPATVWEEEEILRREKTRFHPGIWQAGDQYIGMLGSTSRAQRLMPPSRLWSFL
jgi:hypothetical protein